MPLGRMGRQLEPARALSPTLSDRLGSLTKHWGSPRRKVWGRRPHCCPPPTDSRSQSPDNKSPKGKPTILASCWKDTIYSSRWLNSLFKGCSRAIFRAPCLPLAGCSLNWSTQRSLICQDCNSKVRPLPQSLHFNILSAPQARSLHAPPQAAGKMDGGLLREMLLLAPHSSSQKK